MKENTYNEWIIKGVIIIILVILIFIGYQKDKINSSIREDKRNFSITDTLSIDQIKLENRNLETISLYRDEGKWILNDTLIANPYTINLLLKTIKEMRIKQPVARSALNNVIKNMGIQNTRVDFYAKKKKIKTIYIGGETADQLGTFMMLKDAKEPYIVHIPGFNGYLSSRFSCKENLWREKKIFPDKIKTIWYQTTDEKKQIKDWTETDFGYLKQVFCEKFIMNTDIKTNLKKRSPFMELKWIDTKGNKQVLSCVRKKPVNKEKYKNNKYDQERFYGIINNTVMLIQYKQFQNFFLNEKLSIDLITKHEKNKTKDSF